MSILPKSVKTGFDEGEESTKLLPARVPARPGSKKASSVRSVTSVKRNADGSAGDAAFLLALNIVHLLPHRNPSNPSSVNIKHCTLSHLFFAHSL